MHIHHPHQAIQAQPEAFLQLQAQALVVVQVGLHNIKEFKMADFKLNNFLLGALVLISCTMFIWTMNYISASNNSQIPTAISAFNA